MTRRATVEKILPLVIRAISATPATIFWVVFSTAAVARAAKLRWLAELSFQLDMALEYFFVEKTLRVVVGKVANIFDNVDNVMVDVGERGGGVQVEYQSAVVEADAECN